VSKSKERSGEMKKGYRAYFRYRTNNNELMEITKDIMSNSLKDAKITAQNLAHQYQWWFMGVELIRS
jgi:hypothetical protein